MNFKTKKEKINFFSENCFPEKTPHIILFEGSFLKQTKKHIKTKKDILILCEAIKLLLTDGDLKNKKFKAHNLKGDLKEFREAHIKNDLLLIWKKENNKISLTALGTHSELFN